MRLPQIAIVVMLAIAAVQIAYYYPQLPNVVAGHFGLSGAPDSWVPKGAFFAPFFFVYLLSAVLYLGMPHLIMAMPPSLINMPNKAYWLAPERKEVTAHIVGDQLAWLGVALIAFIISVCQLTINANLPGSRGELGPAMWWITGIFLAFAIAWTIRFYLTFRTSH
ncbi:MAG TPA: DUF1648 domain-containing protein [Candidatus Eremiobacteraceae bacterium]|nr:DUF1648 domain-containing protein [Candidatus Eremiobacteraceae bacterium]